MGVGGELTLEALWWAHLRLAFVRKDLLEAHLFTPHVSGRPSMSMCEWFRKGFGHLWAILHAVKINPYGLALYEEISTYPKTLVPSYYFISN